MLTAFLKFIHITTLATMVFVLAWAQSASERTSVLEHADVHISARIDKLEAIQIESRLRVIEVAIIDLKEGNTAMRQLQGGGMLGLAGIGVGQIVMVRLVRKKKKEEDEG